MLSLELGCSTIRLAKFSISNDSLKIVSCDEERLDLLDTLSHPDADVKLSGRIKGLLARLNISPAPVTVCVTPDCGYLCTSLNPSYAAEKMQQMMLYEAEQQFAVPLKSVVWDFQIMGTKDDGIYVLLSAIQKKVVKLILAATELAGLIVDVCALTPVAIYNAYKTAYPAANGRVMIVHVEDDAITMLLDEGDIPFFASSRIPIANTASLDVDRYSASLSSEITNFAENHNVAPDADNHCRIMVAGNPACVRMAENIIWKDLKVSAEYLCVPLELDLNLAKNISSEGSRHGTCSLAMVGMAWRCAGKGALNLKLLPKTYIYKAGLQKRMPYLLATTLTLIVILIGYASLLWAQANCIDEQLAAAQIKLNNVEVIAASMRVGVQTKERALREMRTVQLLNANRSKWLRVLAEVKRSIPRGLWITSIENRPVERGAEDNGDKINGGCEVGDGEPLIDAAREEIVVEQLAMRGAYHRRQGRDGAADLVEVFVKNLEGNRAFSGRLVNEINMLQPDGVVREFALKFVK